jgi:type IV secretory pathway VirB2 component (pilin)
MKTFILSPSGKRALMLAARLFIFSALVFADDAFGIEDRMKVLLEVVSSPWVRGIAVIALIVECIALITAGRQEPGMFKKFVPWIAGTIIFMAASSITKTFLDPENADISNVLEAGAGR